MFALLLSALALAGSPDNVKGWHTYTWGMRSWWGLVCRPDPDWADTDLCESPLRDDHQFGDAWIDTIALRFHADQLAGFVVTVVDPESAANVRKGLIPSSIHLLPDGSGALFWDGQKVALTVDDGPPLVISYIYQPILDPRKVRRRSEPAPAPADTWTTPSTTITDEPFVLPASITEDSSRTYDWGPNCTTGKPCGQSCIPIEKTCHADESTRSGASTTTPQCKKGKPCGASCIAIDKTCHK